MAYYCIKNVNETRALKSGWAVLETILFNTRGSVASTIKIYDATSANEDYLVAEFDIFDADSLIQYINTGLQLDNGLTYKTSGNPGNITILYK